MVGKVAAGAHRRTLPHDFRMHTGDGGKFEIIREKRERIRDRVARLLFSSEKREELGPERPHS